MLTIVCFRNFYSFLFWIKSIRYAITWLNHFKHQFIENLCKIERIFHTNTHSYLLIWFLFRILIPVLSSTYSLLTAFIVYRVRIQNVYIGFIVGIIWDVTDWMDWICERFHFISSHLPASSSSNSIRIDFSNTLLYMWIHTLNSDWALFYLSFFSLPHRTKINEVQLLYTYICVCVCIALVWFGLLWPLYQKKIWILCQFSIPSSSFLVMPYT